VTGVEERLKKQHTLNISGIRNLIFALNHASKVLENQVKGEVFIGAVQLVQWHQNHGINNYKKKHENSNNFYNNSIFNANRLCKRAITKKGDTYG